VQLVDEQNDAARSGFDLFEHRLEAILELTAELGSGDQRSKVEREQTLVAQAVWHIALCDAMTDALDDRRLAHAGLADDHGIVLGATREHLDDAANLFVATDHRIDLAGRCRCSDVACVLLQRLELAFGVRVGHPLCASHLAQRLL
jgi:hypothetical protein